ncbi:MAG: CheR family methyltransferase [Verrucomicrobiota bacterium]
MKLPEQIHQRLLREYGFDTSMLQGPNCTAAVHARMRHTHCDDERSYLADLQNSSQEFDAFIDEMLVPESWFFRDRAPFTFLQEWAQSAWKEKAGDDSRLLRILSVPCATGPEPYSIAMTLIDAGLSPRAFRVYAGDVSARNLEAAERGEYRPMALRGQDADGRMHHFESLESGRYRVCDTVKRCVSFKACNLLDPTSLAFAPSFDLVFCRNVLIYFSNDARRATVDNLLNLMTEGGLLFVGHADGLSVVTDELEPAGPASAFCYRRSTTVQASEVKKTRSPFPAKTRSTHPPLPKPVPRPARKKPVAKPTLAEVAKLADAGQLESAHNACLVFLQNTSPTAEALFLLGQITLALELPADAEDALRKAVYLNPRHAEALLMLALMVERRGSTIEAERLRRRAKKHQEVASGG